MSENEESALLHAHRRGDAAGFEGLVHLYHDRVYRTAYSIVADPDDAADIEQETWVKAWTRLPDFQEESTFGTWITRLTINAAADKLRRQRVRRFLWPISSALPTVDAIIDSDELRHAF